MPALNADKYKSIAFQGAHGAYSDLACRTVFPKLQTQPCDTFEEAFEAVKSGKTDLAMIPVDNTLAGRVADVHHLLPASGLYIVGEHFQQIRHALLGVKGAAKEELKHVHSHVHAIPQCRKLIQRLGLKAHVHADTAGAAAEVAANGDKAHGAIASPLAAEIYGLDILEEDVQDAGHNTTRFLMLSRDPLQPEDDGKTPYITSFTFRVRNIPAALYKALGGFASNGINMLKLESYVDENFQAAQFYTDIQGHPDSGPVQLALEELGFFSSEFRFLGTYPAHSFRKLG